MKNQEAKNEARIGGSGLNAGLGEILPKNAMFFHTSSGTAKVDDREYEMLNDMAGTPIVRSKQTGQHFRLPWQTILELAIKSGIDTPNVK